MIPPLQVALFIRWGFLGGCAPKAGSTDGEDNEEEKGSGDAVRHFRFLFLTSWQASGTTCLYHPNHIETQERDFFWQKKRCGKASRSGKRRMAFGSLLCFLQQADRWDDVPCLRRISKQWLRYSLKAAAYGNNNVAECSRNYRYSYIHTKKWSHSQRKRAHPQ